jgi:hypothetical protein
MVRSASSFIILKKKPIFKINENKENSKFENTLTKEILLGKEIFSINSNLSNLSYDHFSKSYSRGVS